MTLVVVDLDGMFHILHSLFYVKVDLYSTSRNLCSCQVKLPTEGLPPVVEIPHKTFALWRSVRAMPQVHHVRILGGISLPDWQTMPCNRVGNTAGLDYLDLACQGLSPPLPGMRVLVVGDRVEWTAEHLCRIQGAIPHYDRSRDSFQGGHRLV